MALPREVTVLSGVFEMATRSDQKVIPLTSGSILFEIPGGKGWALIQMRGAGGGRVNDVAGTPGRLGLAE